jgi:succinoglycan biosynthesis protein ExoO
VRQSGHPSELQQRRPGPKPDGSEQGDAISSDGQAERAVDVTVVIPAFNAAGFVHRAIDSALSQEGVALEVVVVDDASSDDTATAVRERYPGAENVRVHRLDRNSGPSAARNAGFQRARGKWIAVLDADDIFAPGRLRRLFDAGERLGTEMIADNVRFYDAVKDRLHEPMLREMDAERLLDLHTFVAGARPGTGELDFGLLQPMFLRSFLERHGLRYAEDVRHGEDFLLYFEALLSGARFVTLAEAGYHCTLRNSGQSRTVVDYPSQIRDVQRLQQRPDVSKDARLMSLLNDRSRALARWSTEHAFYEAVRRRRYGRALFLCLSHPTLFLRAGAAAFKRFL